MVITLEYTIDKQKRMGREMTNREYICNFTNLGEKSWDEKIELSKRQLAYAITSVVASVMLADNLSDAFEIAHKEIREVLDELFSGNPKIESDNLKEVLFKEAYEQFHTCDEAYDALFAVICNADLEREYLSFVRKESSHG